MEIISMFLSCASSYYIGIYYAYITYSPLREGPCNSEFNLTRPVTKNSLGILLPETFSKFKLTSVSILNDLPYLLFFIRLP